MAAVWVVPGEDRTALLEPEPAEFAALGLLLQRGLDQAAQVALRMERLGELLMTGRPPAIADGASMVELSLAAAQPVFVELAGALDRLGTPRMKDLAIHLRRN